MNIDTLFASLFATTTVGVFVLLTLMTASMPSEQDSRRIFNNMLSTKSIALSFGLILIPAFSFASKGMIWSSVATIMMASVAAFCLTRMSNRARVILRKRHYI